MSDDNQIFNAVQQGDPRASDQLLALVYDELRRLAAQKMAVENPTQTLQATALVHEAYIRLVDANRAQRWESRGHFYAAASEAMRRILVENARRKRRLRHGGKFFRQPLDDFSGFEADSREDIVSLDEALTKLAVVNPQAAELVQLRYFTGMTMPEVSAALKLPERTAARLWTYARAWLLREIQGSPSGEGN